MKEKEESDAYILGTEKAELHRLGLQHQVWASEARKGWNIAEFGDGQTILDLGCGPGFCTRDLAYMVGKSGKVIGVDRSKAFIDFLDRISKLYELNIETQACDFDDMVLENDSLDGVYDRWGLCWVPDPLATIENIVNALKPGGAFVAHEYFDWSVFQTEPALPGLKKAIGKAFQSFQDMDGHINLGRHLPRLFHEAGLEVINYRTMSKIATPDDLTWQWPFTFLEIYLPKLIESNYLTEKEVRQALEDLDELTYTNGSAILCPHMVEVIAIKA